MSDWKPLFAQVGDELVDGVPDYLVDSLIDWADESEQLLGVDSDGYYQQDRQSFVQRFDRMRRERSGLSVESTESFFKKNLACPDLILDYLDYLVFNLAQLPALEHHNIFEDHSTPPAVPANKQQTVNEDAVGLLQKLDKYLEQGGSKWRVDANVGSNHLVERVTPAMEDAAAKVMSECGDAGNLLAMAWHQLFGRNPNSTEAYSTIVKALETATKNSIAPDDAKYTLGKGLNNMRTQHWHYAIEADLGEDTQSSRNVDGGVIQLMMRSIWESQQDRHGTEHGSQPVSSEKARAAIFLAVPVIQVFHDGLVSKQVQ